MHEIDMSWNTNNDPTSLFIVVGRNAKIAHIFFEMGLVEELGFGMEELSKVEGFGLPKPEFALENETLKAMPSVKIR